MNCTTLTDMLLIILTHNSTALTGSLLDKCLSRTQSEQAQENYPTPIQIFFYSPIQYNLNTCRVMPHSHDYTYFATSFHLHLFTKEHCWFPQTFYLPKDLLTRYNTQHPQATCNSLIFINATKKLPMDLLYHSNHGFVTPPNPTSGIVTTSTTVTTTISIISTCPR